MPPLSPQTFFVSVNQQVGACGGGAAAAFLAFASLAPAEAITAAAATAITAAYPIVRNVMLFPPRYDTRHSIQSGRADTRNSSTKNEKMFEKISYLNKRSDCRFRARSP